MSAREDERLRGLLLEKTEELMRLKKRNQELEFRSKARDEEIQRLQREVEEKSRTIKTLEQSRVSWFIILSSIMI